MTNCSHNSIPAHLVSTIIPVYNRAIFLNQAVESVIGQTYRPIEIILVDDGSTDDTCQLISGLLKKHPDVVRSIRIENSGPGGAREHGRQIAKGEFIQYLDSDDLLHPNKFTNQVTALQANPECGAAYGKTRLVDEAGQVLIAPFKSSGQKADSLFPELLVDRWWNTHTPLYRKSICDQVGPWTSMRMGEDWLYDARVGALQTKLVFCDTFVADHRQHSHDRLTGGTISPAALRDFGRLLPELYRCALQAHVPDDCPEMQHFSRWAFSLARQLGRAGDSALAKGCFDVAIQADRTDGRGLEYRLFNFASRFFGWKIAGLVSEVIRSGFGKRAGKATLPQSWMKH